MADGFVHPAFAEVVETFQRMFRRPSHGGGALAVTVDGETVIDIWAGWRDRDGSQPWERDTIAMCFSTTKGIAATLLHRVMEQRGLSYDQPVAELWPDFGANGKQDITVREMLAHAGGLHRVRGVLTDPSILLDHRAVASALAAAPADEARRGTPGYHALSFGWLVAGLIEAITEEDVREVLRSEIADPMGLDGLWFGAPPSERSRLAPLFPELDFSDETVERLARSLGAVAVGRGLRDAAMIPGFAPLVFSADHRIHDTVMPSVNGAFTARSLAAVYAALAADGSHDGYRLLSPERLHEVGRIQYRKRDFVLGLPMRWRLGYHQAFTGLRGWPRRAFGHFGAGGSGAWADPETRVSLGFVTNRMGSTTTPVGDARLIRVGGRVIRAARQA